MRCKNCGWGNPDGSSKCEKCGAVLSESANDSSSTKYQSTEGFDPRKTAVGCPQCGYPVRPSDEQCPNCEAPLVGGGAKTPANKLTGGTVIGSMNPNAKPTNGKKLAGFLVSYTHNPLGDFYPVLEGRNYIGRDSSSTICIPNDALISGKHFSILYRSVDKKFKFRDEQSSNGSFVNEELTDEGELKNLDVIRIGSTRLLLMIVPEF
jgi:pSer/pThr/pTyr-binding forkhead associated (FHA) protein